jgi:hypothetical protein
MRKFDKIVVRLLILLIIAASSSACFFFNPDVHYVLPNGYIGMFKIILDESNGIDVERTNWRYVYEIPPDGILRVKSFAPFRDLHEEKVAYKNGANIPSGLQVKDDVIALRSAGTGEREGYPLTMTLVIGTEKQVFYTAQQQQADNEFDEIPPLVFNERLKQIK